MPVFDRIEMDVIEVPHKIVLVTQGVLPIPPLPNPALSLGGTAGRDPFAAGQTARKSAFDQPPPQREIGIALGQGPDHVQMIGQNYGSFNRKPMPSPHPAKRRPQYINTFCQESQPALPQIDREEIAASGQEIATIVRHCGRASDGFRFAQPILHHYYTTVPRCLSD